jgi:hypothetical protein
VRVGDAATMRAQGTVEAFGETTNMLTAPLEGGR